MTLCELGTSALVSEPTVCCTLSSLSELLRGAVDAEESDDWNGALMLETTRGMMLVGGGTVGIGGIAFAMLGERGVMSCLS